MYIDVTKLWSRYKDSMSANIDNTTWDRGLHGMVMEVLVYPIVFGHLGCFMVVTSHNKYSLIWLYGLCVVLTVNPQGVKGRS